MQWPFHPDAEVEFIESAAYYESQVPGLGRSFGRVVREALELLVKNPGIGSPLPGEMHSFVLGSFPYSVVYTRDGDVLSVIAVAHNSRKPGYWKSRSLT